MDDDVAGLRPSEGVLVAWAPAPAPIVSILRKKRQPMSAYHVEVRGDQRAEHPRSFVRIDVLHEIAGEWVDAEAVRRSIELGHALLCGHRTARVGDVTISHRFRLGDAGRYGRRDGSHGHLVVFAEQQAGEVRE
jgi:putative redox protein